MYEQLGLFEWSQQSRLKEAVEYGFSGFDEYYSGGDHVQPEDLRHDLSSDHTSSDDETNHT